MTLKEHSAFCPSASLATQITLFVPNGKKLPELGVDCSAIFCPQLDRAVGLNVTAVPTGLVHSTVMSEGQSIVMHGCTAASVLGDRRVKTVSTVIVSAREE